MSLHVTTAAAVATIIYSTYLPSNNKKAQIVMGFSSVFRATSMLSQKNQASDFARRSGPSGTCPSALLKLLFWSYLLRHNGPIKLDSVVTLSRPSRPSGAITSARNSTFPQLSPPGFLQHSTVTDHDDVSPRSRATS